MPNMERMAEDVHAALSKIISDHEGGFIIKWVTLVESADANGERGLWTLASEDTKRWDIIGMLQYGLQVEQAKHIIDP